MAKLDDDTHQALDIAASSEALDRDDGATERLLELVESAREERPSDEGSVAPIPTQIAGVVVGRLLEVAPSVRVAWAGAPEGCSVRSMVPVDLVHLGREVALMFEGHDRKKPFIIGLVETFAPKPRARDKSARANATGVSIDITNDKRRIVLEAGDELVLRSGESSITLTKAGKIIIRGAYVSSTASGTHRIRGGSVEIN